MRYIKLFEAYRIKKNRDEIIKEAVLQVNDLYRVKTMIDVPQSLINAYVKKVKDTTGKDMRKMFGDVDIAEEIVKYIALNGMDVDKIPGNAVMGGVQGQPQGQAQSGPQVQIEGGTQVMPQAQTQVQPQSQPQAQPQGQPLDAQGQPQAQPQGQPQAQPQGQPQAQPQGQPAQGDFEEPQAQNNTDFDDEEDDEEDDDLPL